MANLTAYNSCLYHLIPYVYREHYAIFYTTLPNKVGATDPVLLAEHFTASNCITQLDWELLCK